MRRCSVSLAIVEMQIENTVRCHFIPTRMAEMKKRQTIASIGEDRETMEPSYLVGRDVKWCCCFGKQSCSSSNA